MGRGSASSRSCHAGEEPGHSPGSRQLRLSPAGLVQTLPFLLSEGGTARGCVRTGFDPVSNTQTGAQSQSLLHTPRQLFGFQGQVEATKYINPKTPLAPGPPMPPASCPLLLTRKKSFACAGKCRAPSNREVCRRWHCHRSWSPLPLPAPACSCLALPAPGRMPPRV